MLLGGIHLAKIKNSGAIRMANFLYEMCLQGIMVAVLIGLNICVDDYNYHDSLQERFIEGMGHWGFWR